MIESNIECVFVHNKRYKFYIINRLGRLLIFNTTQFQFQMTKNILGKVKGVKKVQGSYVVDSKVPRLEVPQIKDVAFEFVDVGKCNLKKLQKIYESYNSKVPIGYLKDYLEGCYEKSKVKEVGIELLKNEVYLDYFNTYDNDREITRRLIFDYYNRLKNKLEYNKTFGIGLNYTDVPHVIEFFNERTRYTELYRESIQLKDQIDEDSLIPSDYAGIVKCLNCGTEFKVNQLFSNNNNLVCYECGPRNTALVPKKNYEDIIINTEKYENMMAERNAIYYSKNIYKTAVVEEMKKEGNVGVMLCFMKIKLG